jgi:hypothetical protein
LFLEEIVVLKPEVAGDQFDTNETIIRRPFSRAVATT